MQDLHLANEDPANKGPTSPRTGSLLDGYLAERDAAAELKLMPRTLRKYRDEGAGPAYVIIGRKVFYPRDALLQWVASKLVTPVRERKPARRPAA
jgi:hypothetical protein